MTGSDHSTGDAARIAAELTAVPILLICEASTVVWANPEAEEWLGRSLRALQKTGLASVGPIGPVLAEFADQAIVDKRSRIALSRSLADGHRYDLHMRWSDENSVVAISAFRHTQSDPLASQNAALGFGRMLAHELKNPLASVRGAAQLIRRNVNVDAEVEELSGMIVEDVDRVTRLADHWSQVGDIALGRTGAVNLNRLAISARESLVRAQAEAGNCLVDRFDPSLPQANGDNDLLHQAILNLLQNASDAVAALPDGRIEVLTGFDTGPRSRTSGGSAPLVLSVIDNGPGIPEALGAGIFTPFVTTKPAGEGLGLAFAARIAALHEGQLDYQSEPGHTVFNFRLPVAAEITA
jgi:two-component system nitrogen regulation sensor histidine kinase GlnL